MGQPQARLGDGFCGGVGVGSYGREEGEEEKRIGKAVWEAVYEGWEGWDGDHRDKGARVEMMRACLLGLLASDFEIGMIEGREDGWEEGWNGVNDEKLSFGFLSS